MGIYAPFIAGRAVEVSLTLEFQLNGSQAAALVDEAATLQTVLRAELGLTSPKRGCLQGTCGTCTVLVDGAPYLSCLMLAQDVAGRAVQTLEGLKQGAELSPLQRAFMEHFAAQCGFCTPGMLMAASALLHQTPKPTREQVVDAISGNICRYTGYAPIISAVLAAAAGDNN
ncbi:MAG: 2Fe-2S iron-sulfur cluster binding domain-containing protein [Gammaproteobacteria bacterium]|nr:2Fe-2S iron-sulfur cluster binding domain-containing protein [Gammaproteobacteria bacterium]NKC11676.1 2Fe-2S iron-sulfur cluster binding domain-containing protein [Gammaproteobacteria bacterium]